jgi:ABC-type amino acid transport substrate-binding protein
MMVSGWALRRRILTRLLRWHFTGFYGRFLARWFWLGLEYGCIVGFAVGI